MPIRFPEMKMDADAAQTQEVSDAIPNRGMIPGGTPILPSGEFTPGRFDVIPRDPAMEQMQREAPPQAFPKFLEGNPGRVGRDIEYLERVVPRQEEPVPTPQEMQMREQQERWRREMDQKMKLLISGYKLLEILDKH